MKRGPDGNGSNASPEACPGTRPTRPILRIYDIIGEWPDLSDFVPVHHQGGGTAENGLERALFWVISNKTVPDATTYDVYVRMLPNGALERFSLVEALEGIVQ